MEDLKRYVQFGLEGELAAINDHIDRENVTQKQRMYERGEYDAISRVRKRLLEILVASEGRAVSDKKCSQKDFTCGYISNGVCSQEPAICNNCTRVTVKSEA